MNKRLLPAIAISASLLMTACSEETTAPAEPTMSVTRTLGNQDIEGYKRAGEPRVLNFPEDHGSHPEFKNEWWYVTGNAEAESGELFGFQFTIFRSALAPPNSDNSMRSSNWATNQAFLAHTALSDIDGGHFYHDERFSRGAMELSGAESAPFRVWLDDWKVAQEESLDSNCSDCFHARTAVEADGFSLDLVLSSDRGPVLHGDRGLSAKSDTPGNASYYYSYTRLMAMGDIRVGDRNFRVHGQAWFDHEWSTSALEDDQQGWDWFSLQLDDGSDLMLFKLRNKTGPTLDFANGTLVDAGGNTFNLDRDEFTIAPTAMWRSDFTGAIYPTSWSISVPAHELQLEVQAMLPEQEINSSFRYWEGAVEIRGTSSDNPLSGKGYAELTGYGNQGEASK